MHTLTKLLLNELYLTLKQLDSKTADTIITDYLNGRGRGRGRGRSKICRNF